MNTVRFGYEVGTGKPVEIPMRHMVITGQSQEAGKTTALEALVARSGVRAVAFITKRGEGSFADAREIRPYFSERTGEDDFLDWKYVASILEASLGEKLKFERSWIMRATKGTRTLADVYANVKAAIADPKTRGLSADVYYALGEYLKAIVPQIAKVRWATTVELAAGVSAMDLTGINEAMQHLVIRSTLDWVHNNADHTVVVIPEAWKFIPEGRGAPVKLAAESFVRQGAGLKNYLWLDSQDIAGVEKTILKQATVWVLGVQRESNEVKRTLAQIPRRIKEPTPDAIATLKLGEFYVCHGTEITKVYAQPRWMEDADAVRIARGDLTTAGYSNLQKARRADYVERATSLYGRPVVDDDHDTHVELYAVGQARRAAQLIAKTEDAVTPERAAELERENKRLDEENHDLRNDLQTLTTRVRLMETAMAPSSKPRGPESATVSGHRDNGDAGKLPAGATAPIPEVLTNDDLYDAIKRRLIAEAPGILKVLTIKPELEVTVERQVLKADGSTLKGRMALLLKDGFFREPRGSGAVRGQLARTGADANTANIGRALDEFKAMGFLTEQAAGQFQEVADMKVNVVKA